MTVFRRRWSFSLRTLFVVVTVIGAWTGWQLHAVRDRTRMAGWIEAHGGIVNRLHSPTPSSAWPAGSKLLINSDLMLGVMIENKDRNIATWRTWLGDEAVSWIAFPVHEPQTKMDRATSLFPEALVRRMPTLTTDSSEIDPPSDP